MDGVGSSASFSSPSGVAVTFSGALLVADEDNNRIRLVSPSGMVTTLAGSGDQTWADGVGSQASFSGPIGMAVTASGVVLVADAANHRIRAISPSGMVTTLAGSGHQTWADGLGSQASFNSPTGVAVKASGAVLVTDTNNHRLRLISPSGMVTTFAGSGNADWVDGVGSQASFNYPTGLAVMASGTVVISDSFNHRIRLVTPLGVVTTFAGSGNEAWADGVGSQASFNGPQGLAVMASGTIFVADAGNRRIRLVSPSGIITTFAGDGDGVWADGVGLRARFNNPSSLVVTSLGTVFVTDQGNHRIRNMSALFPFRSMCTAGFSGARTSNCSRCSVGTLCPPGTTVIMWALFTLILAFTSLFLRRFMFLFVSLYDRTILSLSLFFFFFFCVAPINFLFCLMVVLLYVFSCLLILWFLRRYGCSVAVPRGVLLPRSRHGIG